jgi:zinc transport system ATP-binding protein
MRNAIDVDNLTVTMQDKEILKNISFHVPERTINAIIGPNGSGKSTLLKALLQIVPYSGHVRFFHDNYPDYSKVGYVPQKYDFDRSIPLSVYEFLSLSLFNQSESKKNEIILKSLEELQITDLRNTNLRYLSGGQLQRVLVARSILTDPKILFLDEATAGIDYEGVKSLYDVLRHLKSEHGTTIIMVSHEINMVPKIADRLICLGHGYVCSGLVKEVLTASNLTKVYAGGVDLHAFE